MFPGGEEGDDNLGDGGGGEGGAASDRVVLLGRGSAGAAGELFGDDDHRADDERGGVVYARCRQFCGRFCTRCPCYPRAGDVNIFTSRNLAIPVFYTMLGFLLKFPYIALRFYMRDTLKATPPQQAIVYSVVMGMPWNFKMVYGFISDTCPIRGRRRKPYMLGGTICCSASWLLFGVWHFPDPPAMGLMCALLFMAILGMIFADVMADALVVERMKGEKPDRKGGIQSTCWMLRFSGSLAGFIVGGWLMEWCVSPQSIFFLTGLVPIFTMLPPLWLLDDPVVKGYAGGRIVSDVGLARVHHADVGAGASPTVGEAAHAKIMQVWDCVQMNHIWMPMTFIFVFAATPSAGDAFANFILGPLCFTDAMYASLSAIGMAASLLGTFIYKRYLRAVPFRKLFCVTLCIAAAFSASQLILVTGLNRKMGIPDFVFAVGDEVIVDTASFIVQMPTLVMCASLCPTGVESTLYALMTVVNNIALSVGGSFSAALAEAFGITLTNFDNLWALVLVTSISTLIPICLIPLVPEGVEDCESAATAVDAGNGEDGNGEAGGGRDSGGDDENARPASRNIQRSRYGGGGFVAVLVIGLLYSIINAGVKLSASDPAPAPVVPVPGIGNLTNSSGTAPFAWTCEKAEENTCGEAIPGEDDDEEDATAKTDE